MKIFFIIILLLLFPSPVGGDEMKDLLVEEPTKNSTFEECQRMKTCPACLISNCVYSINGDEKEVCVPNITYLEEISFIILPSVDALLSCPRDTMNREESFTWPIYALLSCIIVLLATVIGILFVFRRQRMRGGFDFQSNKAYQQDEEVEMETIF